jgi:hypothetical protein
MKTLKFITTGLFVLGTTFLVAETLPANGPLTFNTYDKDNNKVITVKEFNKIKAQRMIQNQQTGKLIKNAKNTPMFSDIDTNDDGIITQKELTIHQQSRFNQRVNQKNPTMKKGMKRSQGIPGQGQSKNW